MKNKPIAGFTGTRFGMTTAQMKQVYNILTQAGEFHHGDCVGADHEAYLMAVDLKLRKIAHPPKIDTLRAFTEKNEVVLEPKDYLDRNRDIVDSCDFLIAAPDTQEPKTRSGTWSTIKYAKKKGVPLIVVFPDGSIKAEEG